MEINTQGISILDIVSFGLGIFSLLIASISLGWNIYRDVILKPRLKVKFGLYHFVQTGLVHTKEIEQKYLKIGCINFGPGEIIINSIEFESKPLFVISKKEYRQGFIIPDDTNPLSTKLPVKLKVGEGANLILPYKKANLLNDKITRIGVADSFGRVHFCSKQDVKNAKNFYIKEFGKDKNE